MRLHPIAPDELGDYWPRIACFATQMAERFPDDWPTHEQRRAASEGDIVIWVILDDEEPQGIFATRKKRLPSGRMCMSIPFCAGVEHRNWQTEVREHVERMARLNLCDVVESVGREGWLREAPGYKPVWVGLFRKEITLG